MSTTSVRRGAARGKGAPAPLRTRRRARAGFLLTVPALLLVLAIVIVPIVFAIYISLTDWPLFGDIHWVGFENYANLGKDPVFFRSVGFTFLYTAIVTLPILVIGYALATFVRRKRRGTVLFRTLFFLPVVVGLTTESFLLVTELVPGSGLVNVVLHALGITDGQTAWNLNPWTGLIAVSGLVIWFAGGQTMMLLLIGMQAIPTDLYEAAETDGANRRQQEMRITLPLVRRSIALSLVISIIGSFLAFQQFVIITNGGPFNSTTTVVMRVYQEAFVNQRVGSATAMGIVVMLGIAALTCIQLFALRDRDGRGAA